VYSYWKFFAWRKNEKIFEIYQYFGKVIKRFFGPPCKKAKVLTFSLESIV